MDVLNVLADVVQYFECSRVDARIVLDECPAVERARAIWKSGRSRVQDVVSNLGQLSEVGYDLVKFSLLFRGQRQRLL